MNSFSFVSKLKPGRKMSIKKQFFKTKPTCKVTFRLSKDELTHATEISVVGDFNKWDTSAHIMKPLKNGTFKTSIELEKGRKYQFRYLINGRDWENDLEADSWAPTPYSDAQNSVIIL